MKEYPGLFQVQGLSSCCSDDSVINCYTCPKVGLCNMWKKAWEDGHGKVLCMDLEDIIEI